MTKCFTNTQTDEKSRINVNFMILENKIAKTKMR